MREWTTDHCERCFGEDYPKLAVIEIYCIQHYNEWLNEPAEEA